MNQQKMKWLYVLCGVIVIAAVVVSVTGLFNEVTGYANAEKYTAGDTVIREQVKNLDVNWTSGNVAIAYHGDQTVEIAETANRALNEDQKLRWWLDGETLRIQYAKSGLRMDMNLDKKLTVTLPEEISMDEVQISVTSADVSVPDLKADRLQFSATSGDAVIQAEAGTVDASQTSGNLKMILLGDVREVRMNSTSGSILLEAEKAKKIKAGSTSGSVEINCGENDETDISSTSGAVRANLRKIGRVKIGTTSGTVTAGLPELPGLTAKISTTSGQVATEMAMQKDGNTYRCGDGSGQVEIGTTSGSVKVLPAK